MIRTIPPLGVQLDYSNPLTVGVKLCLVSSARAGQGLVDIGPRRRKHTMGGTVTWTNGPYGPQAAQGADGVHMGTGPILADDPRTVIQIGENPAINDAIFNIDDGVVGGFNGTRYSFLRGTSGDHLRVEVNGGASLGTQACSTYGVYGTTYPGSGAEVGDSRFFANGVMEAGSSNTRVLDTADRTWSAFDGSSGANPGTNTGKQTLLLVLRRHWTDGMFRLFYADPWQIFKRTTPALDAALRAATAATGARSIFESRIFGGAGVIA